MNFLPSSRFASSAPFAIYFITPYTKIIIATANKSGMTERLMRHVMKLKKSATDVSDDEHDADVVVVCAASATSGIDENKRGTNRIIFFFILVS